MNILKKTTLATCIGLCCGLGMTSASADQGDWLVKFGGVNVDPDSSSRGVVADDAVSVDDNTQLFVTATYMLKENIGLEILAATPFSHDILLDGVGKIAETDHLPPTVSLQYHFNTASSVRPYIGAGLNYTTFFSEDATAAISDIDLDDSWGLALQAGVDIDINEKWFFNADVRKIDISTTADTDLGSIDVDIDPMVYSIGFGMRL